MSFLIAYYRISPKYTSEKIVTYAICSMSFHSALKIAHITNQTVILNLLPQNKSHEAFT